MSQKELDRITDKVMAYDPDAPTGPLKVIAGAPDRPLVIGDVEIQCYVLEDETRVLSQGGFLQALGRTGKPKHGHDDVFNLPIFLSPSNLKPFLNKDIIKSSTPVQFRAASGGGLATGYNASILPQVCEVYLAAHDAGAIKPSQRHVVRRAYILMRGLAKVGIIALVDEATGYQRIREERALATILERLIAKELNPWTRTFDFEFYKQICRLRDWPSVRAIKRPSVIGKYTNDFVYDRLAPGVLDELNRVNPVIPETKRRRHKHHQWLTPELGHPKLRRHVWAVTALMRAAPSWRVFRQNLDRAFPKQNTTVPLALTDQDE